MTIKNIKPISKGQIKIIHVLLSERGIMDEKRNIVHSISSGRTTSTKELTANEARQLIGLLVCEGDKTEKQKSVFRSIYGIAYKMDIIYGDTDDDYQMNLAKLNMFCRERGTVKKNLAEQSYMEMCRTLRQFEAMYNKHKQSKKKENEPVCIK